MLVRLTNALSNVGKLIFSVALLISIVAVPVVVVGLQISWYWALVALWLTVYLLAIWEAQERTAVSLERISMKPHGTLDVNIVRRAQPPNKQLVANTTTQGLQDIGFRIATSNLDKPWGAELKIEEGQAKKFLERFFGDKAIPAELRDNPTGPKILLVQESKRLSWHVHERKDTYWVILQGIADVYLSPTDDEPYYPDFVAKPGKLICILPQIRHRIGAPYAVDWLIVAEISRNVFPDRPSDDSDERIIKDDFGRK